MSLQARIGAVLRQYRRRDRCPIYGVLHVHGDADDADESETDFWGYLGSTGELNHEGGSVPTTCPRCGKRLPIINITPDEAEY